MEAGGSSRMHQKFAVKRLDCRGDVDLQLTRRRSIE